MSITSFASFAAVQIDGARKVCRTFVNFYSSDMPISSLSFRFYCVKSFFVQNAARLPSIRAWHCHPSKSHSMTQPSACSPDNIMESPDRQLSNLPSSTIYVLKRFSLILLRHHQLACPQIPMSERPLPPLLRQSTPPKMLQVLLLGIHQLPILAHPEPQLPPRTYHSVHFWVGRVVSHSRREETAPAYVAGMAWVALRLVGREVG